MLAYETGFEFNKRIALWATVRRLDTGAAESYGYWSGDLDQVITIDSQSRTYYGAGGIVAIDKLVYEQGAVIKTNKISFNGMDPKVNSLLRQFDTRQGLAQIHFISVNSGGIPTAVEEAFVGTIDEFEVTDDAIDENGNMGVNVTMTLVSDARLLTRTLSTKMSDASQRLRDASDEFAIYSDITGVSVNWMGEEDNSYRSRERRVIYR